MLGFVGVTTIETRLATVTVTVVEPLTVPEVAVIVAVPGATPVTTPELLTVAVATSEVLQVTLPVSVFLLPSSKVPVAVICNVLPC